MNALAQGGQVLMPWGGALLLAAVLLALATGVAGIGPVVVARWRKGANEEPAPRTNTRSETKGAEMTVVPDERADILTKRAFGHVATIGPNGGPQVNPVWIDWDGERLRFSQTTTRQKYRNLQRDSRIAVSAYDPDQPYRYVELRGTVDAIDEDPGNEFINRMAKKYMDVDEYPYGQPGEHRVVVSVRPEHTTMM